MIYLFVGFGARKTSLLLCKITRAPKKTYKNICIFFLKQLKLLICPLKVFDLTFKVFDLTLKVFDLTVKVFHLPP